MTKKQMTHDDINICFVKILQGWRKLRDSGEPNLNVIATARDQLT